METSPPEKADSIGSAQHHILEDPRKYFAKTSFIFQMFEKESLEWKCHENKCIVISFHRIFLPIITTQRTAQGYFLSVWFVPCLSLPIKMNSSEIKNFLSLQDLSCFLKSLCSNYLEDIIFCISCELAFLRFP